MEALIQSNPFLRDRMGLRQRLSVNARESSAFEGVRVSAKPTHARPRSIASAKKTVNGR